MSRSDAYAWMTAVLTSSEFENAAYELPRINRAGLLFEVEAPLDARPPYLTMQYRGSTFTDDAYLANRPRANSHEFAVVASAKHLGEASELADVAEQFLLSGAASKTAVLEHPDLQFSREADARVDKALYTATLVVVVQ